MGNQQVPAKLAKLFCKLPGKAGAGVSGGKGLA